MNAKPFSLLAFALLVSAGCGGGIQQIGGISGTTQAGGKPLPERTNLTFYSADSDSSFTAQVDAQGHYSFAPVPGVPIVLGKYKVAIAAPGAKVIEKDGLSMPDPTWKPVKLPVDQRYSKKETTPLEVELSQQPAIFDIKI